MLMCRCFCFIIVVWLRPAPPSPPFVLIDLYLLFSSPLDVRTYASHPPPPPPLAVTGSCAQPRPSPLPSPSFRSSHISVTLSPRFLPENSAASCVACRLLLPFLPLPTCCVPADASWLLLASFRRRPPPSSPLPPRSAISTVPVVHTSCVPICPSAAAPQLSTAVTLCVLPLPPPLRGRLATHSRRRTPPTPTCTFLTCAQSPERLFSLERARALSQQRIVCGMASRKRGSRRSAAS